MTAQGDRTGQDWRPTHSLTCMRTHSYTNQESNYRLVWQTRSSSATLIDGLEHVVKKKKLGGTASICVCVYFCVQEGELEDKAIKEGKVTLEEGLEGMMLGFRIHYKLILFS